MTVVIAAILTLTLPLLLQPEHGGVPRPTPVGRTAEWIVDAVVGDSLNVDGSIGGAVTAGVLAKNRPVYLSLQLEDVPARAEVRICWYGPSGRLLHEQRAMLTSGLDRVSYSLPPDKVSDAGSYRVKVFSGSTTHASREFMVDQEISG